MFLLYLSVRQAILIDFRYLSSLLDFSSEDQTELCSEMTLSTSYDPRSHSACALSVPRRCPSSHHQYGRIAEVGGSKVN